MNLIAFGTQLEENFQVILIVQFGRHFLKKSDVEHFQWCGFAVEILPVFTRRISSNGWNLYAPCTKVKYDLVFDRSVSSKEVLIADILLKFGPYWNIVNCFFGLSLNALKVKTYSWPSHNLYWERYIVFLNHKTFAYHKTILVFLI